MSSFWTFILSLTIYICACVADNCTFIGYIDGVAATTIDLSSLKNENIVGHTSGYTYTYTPCNNGITCHTSKPSQGMFTATNNTGYCQTMSTYDTTLGANYHQATKTFQFIINNGAQGKLCNNIQRIYWICNESVPTYNVIYAGAECVCCWGINIESKLACNPPHVQQSESTQQKHAATCTSAYDCSYNGKCMNSVCKCKPQWKGAYCAQLNILATDKSYGYQGYDIKTNERISSWGGSVIGPDNNGLYHMYAAQMDGGGIFVWRANSILIHAVTNASNGIGKYEYVSTIKGVWSHEPSASLVSQSNEIVIYLTNSPTPNGGNPTISPCKGVYNGMTKDCDIQQITLGDYTPTIMFYSKNANGPWSDIKRIPTQNPYGYDACLSSFFYPNGSFIGMFEGNNGFYIEYSHNWKDNTTYKYYRITIPTGGGEDPFLWVDLEDNVVHVIFHGGGWDQPFGYHAFSVDNGRTWHGFSHDVHAYDTFTEYTDGTNMTFARLERPHLIMADDGYTPVAITNAAQPGGESLDYSYTLLRPINQK